MAENQRRFQRRPLQVEFHAHDAQGTGLLLFEASDLSAGGAFLKSDLLLEPGELLWLEFQVPGVPRVMRAEARVAWVRRFPTETEAAGLGVEFLNMASEEREVLERYLAVGG